MRVTDNMFRDRSLATLHERREDYISAQNQATSGRRALRPSDDPLAMARVRSHQQEVREAENYGRATTLVRSRLQVVEGVIGEAEGLLARAREVAVQGNNGILTAEDRQTLAHEVSEIAGHMRTLAQTQSGSTYLFSGQAERSPSFNPGGAYNGSALVQSVEVAPNMQVQLGLTGQQVFANSAGDAFSALTDLQTALANNDTAQLGASLDALSAASNVVSDARSQVGAQLASVDIAESINSRRGYQAEEAVTREVGADAFTAYSEFTEAQGALAAAVEIVGQLPPPGLASR